VFTAAAETEKNRGMFSQRSFCLVGVSAICYTAAARKIDIQVLLWETLTPLYKLNTLLSTL
jgi:hypothetical protein